MTLGRLSGRLCLLAVGLPALSRAVGAAVLGILATAYTPSVGARAGVVNGVWQEEKGLACHNTHRCELFFRQLSSPQTIQNMSCAIEAEGQFPAAIILGAGVNNAHNRPKWKIDGAFIPPYSHFFNGVKIVVHTATLFAVDTLQYPAIRVDFGGVIGKIEMFCTLAGPNNQP